MYVCVCVYVCLCVCVCEFKYTLSIYWIYIEETDWIRKRNLNIVAQQSWKRESEIFCWYVCILKF